MKKADSILLGASLASATALALEYPHVTAEPQKVGWPLTEEERTYVLKAEYERRPGSESGKHLPALWPVVPSAGNWGGSSWLDLLKLDADPNVRVLDLWSVFTNPDGTLKRELFTSDNIHLSPAGYAVYAEKLWPLLVGPLRKEP